LTQPGFEHTIYHIQSEHTNNYISDAVFGLTRPGFEHTIYHIQSEHTNNYTSDVVPHSLYKFLKA
jgi:hypothetical protein